MPDHILSINPQAADYPRTARRTDGGQTVARGQQQIDQTGGQNGVATLVFMVLAIAWAPLIQFAGGLWDYLQQMFSVLVPPLVVLFMMGALSRFGTEKAGFWTLILGHAIGAALFCLGNAGVMGLLGMDPVWPIHFTINVAIVTVLSLVIYIAISAVTEGRELDDEVIWNREKSLEDAAWGRAWYADIRYQAVVLACSMLAVLIVFW